MKWMKAGLSIHSVLFPVGTLLENDQQKAYDNFAKTHREGLFSNRFLGFSNMNFVLCYTAKRFCGRSPGQVDSPFLLH